MDCNAPGDAGCTECLDIGEYLDGGECLSCDESCKECEGPTNLDCDSCASGYFLFEDTE